MLGALMVVAGLGCVALFFIGPPGGTAGSIPSPASDRAPAQDAGGGPADDTLYLTVPKIGLKDLTVYNSYSEASLDASLIHLPDAGFPWQPGANTYIAGHRMGYSDRLIVRGEMVFSTRIYAKDVRRTRGYLAVCEHSVQ